MSRRDTKPVRRQKTSPAARLRRFWVAALVVIIVGGVIAYLGASWTGFDPAPAAVAGNNLVPKADIVAAARIDPQRNIWLQDSHAMAKRIEAIPLIDVARVHRIFPAHVTIVVTERPPWAILAPSSTPAGRMVIDRDLRALRPPTALDATLPVLETDAALTLDPGTFVKDERAVALRNDADALATAHIDAVALRFDKYESLIVTLRGGLVVLLGDDGDDLAKKIALIAPIRAQLANGRPIAAIDLRALGTPVVRYK